MARIRVLPEGLTNKIAAGEVVQRPASLVKELVENAIDAESHRISIEIQGSGCRAIRVVDDGLGMEEDDVILALERHATSKIEKDEDLAAIQSLGFRGEALPSIAAVSKFELTSRTRTSAAGTKILVSGGVVKKVSQCGCPPGTQVWVRDLFFNQPARRKFLKTEKTEFGHIADMITRLALSRPEVHFSLRLRNRQVHDWPGAVNLEQRLAQVFSKGFSQSWLPLSQQQGPVRIKGCLSPPELHRSSSSMLFLYVNGRVVKDQFLRIAILEAYRTLLPKGQFPLGVLLLELPYRQVDVNVHPTKAEVRFQDPHGLVKIVTSVVRTALSAMESRRWTRPLAAKGWQQAVGMPLQKELKQVPLENMLVAEPEGANYGALDLLSAESPVSKDLAEGKGEKPVGLFGDLSLIGQLHHSYILCEAEDGLVLIDQHAAHERVFFEIFRREAMVGELASQILVVPETIEVTGKEAAWLEDSLPLFSRLGFELEPFGTNTFVVRAVPAVATPQEAQRLLLDLVTSRCEGPKSLGTEDLLEKLLQSMACRVAIKAGQKLGKDEMAALLRKLDALDLSSTCPHGRPLWWKLTLKELERMFGRV